MRRFAVFLLSALPAFAAGTVNQVSQQLGVSNTWALTMNWVGDSGNGSVPATLAKLPPEIGYGQGYRIVSAETAPGTVAPTANYNVMLTDSVGLDLLGGAAIGLSATAAQTFAGNSSAPIYGAFSLLITGNSVGGAKGSVIVYISPISAIVLSPGLIPPPVTPGLIPDTIIAGGSLAAQCAHAQSLNIKYQLALTKNWVLPSQTIPCTIYPAGGSISAGTGQVVHYAGAPILIRQQVFSCGSQYGSIIMDQGYVTPELTGGPYNSMTDATPGVNCALASVNTISGSTVSFDSSTTYSINSDTFGATSVQVCGNNMTLEGNGATIASTLNEPGQIFGVCSTQSNAHSIPSGGNYWSFTSFGPGTNACVTVQTGHGGAFTPGLPVYYQSGTVDAGTPFNSEINLVTTVTGDVVCLQYPIEHQFTYSAPPDGIGPIPPAWMQINFTMENFRTQPQLGKSFASSVNCIHCVYRNLLIDLAQGPGGSGLNGFITGDSRDVLLDNVTLSAIPILGNPGYQWASGMADTTIDHSHFNFYTPSCTTPGLYFSEGSSNDVFQNSSITGICLIGGATFQGAHIINDDININTGAGSEILFTGFGTTDSTGLEIAGNKITSADTSANVNVWLAIPGTRFLNNQLGFHGTSASGTIALTNNCALCIVSGNTGTVATHGIANVGLTNGHNFIEDGNNLTCVGGICNATGGIIIGDDGAQTVSESVVGNTLTGFAFGIEVAALAHEFHPMFSPNAVSGSTTPYSPSSIGTSIPGILGSTVTNLSTLLPLICAPSGPSGITTSANFLFDCNGVSTFQYSTVNNGSITLIFGSPAVPGNTAIKYEDSTQDLQLISPAVNLFTTTVLVPAIPSSAPSTHCALWADPAAGNALKRTTCP